MPAAASLSRRLSAAPTAAGRIEECRQAVVVSFNISSVRHSTSLPNASIAAAVFT